MDRNKMIECGKLIQLMDELMKQPVTLSGSVMLDGLIYDARVLLESMSSELFSREDLGRYRALIDITRDAILFLEGDD